jgi:hypothetical protein
MVSWTGSAPRRARHLFPAWLPRRGEVIAVCAVVLLLVHLLLAQVTLVLAIAFAVTGKASRWRPWWLLAPAVIGMAWALAIGPDRALAGFVAGPSAILWHLSGGHLAGEAGHPFAGFANAQGWLPRQFPIALIAGSAEAALAGWLAWLHTDEWAVPQPRPGLIAAVRRALAVRVIRAGTVVTRDGCALGVVPSSGATAELRWAELAHGTLIVDSKPQGVTLTGLQVVHAALRRRKPVIVLDPGDEAISRALTVACRATGVQLHASGLDLRHVVLERSAALLRAGTAELAARACADLGALAADLRQIGIDGDVLVWVPRGEDVSAQTLAALLRDGPDAGLSLLIGTTSPPAATQLSGLTGSTLIRRVTDRDLAASLAARTGTRLLPAPIAAMLAGQPSATDPGSAASAPELVPSPVIPVRSLLALGQAEFVLAVTAPRQRLVAPGRLVPARLPHRPRSTR